MLAVFRLYSIDNRFVLDICQVVVLQKFVMQNIKYYLDQATHGCVVM